MGETRRTFSRTFDYQAYLWAALLYLLMVELLRNLWAWLENASDAPPEAVTPFGSTHG